MLSRCVVITRVAVAKTEIDTYSIRRILLCNTCANGGVIAVGVWRVKWGGLYEVKWG